MAGSDNSGTFTLFGVKIVVGSHQQSCTNIMKKDKVAEAVAEGYASTDEAFLHSLSSRRKKALAWTEEEHNLFILGLERYGRGHWKEISNDFVKTRTPSQVAAHAQNFFHNPTKFTRHDRRSRRTFYPYARTAMPMGEQQTFPLNNNKNASQSHSHPLTLIGHPTMLLTPLFMRQIMGNFHEACRHEDLQYF